VAAIRSHYGSNLAANEAARFAPAETAWDITGVHVMHGSEQRPHPRCRARVRTAAAFVLALIGGGAIHARPASSSGAQEATAAQRPAAVLAVAATSEPGGAVVAITASGPLPAPRVGVLDDPARIYLDFGGITTRSLHSSGAGDLVVSVRAALHSAAPPVTRVVIDLHQRCAYTVDTSQRTAGRIHVTLHSGGASVAPSTPAVNAAKTPADVPARTAAPRQTPAHATAPRPGRGVAAYRARIAPALLRLENVRTALARIDQRTVVPSSELDAAAADLLAARTTLDAVRAPAAVAEADGMLRSALTLADRALTLARAGSEGVPADAASAAAGALLMLDRAAAEFVPR